MTTTLTTPPAPPVPPLEEIRHRFEYHRPGSAETRAQHTLVRTMTRNLAETFVQELPAGREQALALTKLEEALFWANAAIARHQTDTEGEQA